MPSDKAYHQRRHQRRMELIRSFKQRPCHDCGGTFPHYQLQFDHTRGKKEFIIGTGCPKWSKVLEEIEKCDVVCANCHAARTWFRRCSSNGKTPAS